MSDSSNLIQILINAAEKASNIARVCRSNDRLLQFLVQEKTGSEANVRFEHDFKTLADVLIQETIKHDVGVKFPEMREFIKGEESPYFTNELGEPVPITVNESETDTIKCLHSILNDAVAEALALEVHRDVSFVDEDLGEIPDIPSECNYENLGVWIDPIDATAEYISGDSIFSDFPGITSTGLDCVTVLIGVYDRYSGEPVIGVISQPFHTKVSENVYKSKIYWGVLLPNLKTNNCKFNNDKRSSLLGIFSSSENSSILQKLRAFEFAFSAGAGHKALKVITAEVDFYLLSKGSTFKWDTCAPQAILRSLGGDIFNFNESIKESKPVALTYIDPVDTCDNDWKCNKDGLIALRSVDLLEILLVELAKE